MLTTRVSPLVLGGVAAASADRVVIFDGTECSVLLAMMLPTRVSPPVLGGVAAAAADGVATQRLGFKWHDIAEAPKVRRSLARGEGFAKPLVYAVTMD
jgi:hypothetical protein